MRTSRSCRENAIELVRHHIKLAFGKDMPTVTNIAANLGMSQIELQRLLRSHDVNFNDVVKSTRRELALEYVGKDDAHLTDIALALGYSELSAFSRAFRYWTGMSPMRYRRIVNNSH